jgi:hypothetical protein
MSKKDKENSPEDRKEGPTFSHEEAKKKKKGKYKKSGS